GGLGVFEPPLVCNPPDVNARQADGGGHAVTITVEVCKGLVAHRGEVHADAVKYRHEVLARNGVGADGMVQGGVETMRVLAGEGAVELFAPGVEWAALRLGVAGGV